MMMKSLRATQATERKVEIPKMRVTLSGRTLEGDAAKGRSVCDLDHSVSRAHCAVIANPIGPRHTKILAQIQFRGEHTRSRRFSWNRRQRLEIDG
jgi:hypothetical protein